MSHNSFIVNVVKSASRFSSLSLGKSDKVVESKSFSDQNQAKAFMRQKAKQYNLKRFGINFVNVDTGLETDTNF